MRSRCLEIVVVGWVLIGEAVIGAQPPVQRRQPDETRSTSSAPASISGQVMADDGQPLANASVIAFPAGASRANPGPRTATTDEEGNFRIPNLAPRSYYVTAQAPGLVLAPTPGVEAGEGNLYRAGETVTLRLVKGAVITGRVTNASGEPVIAVSVDAIRVREADGRPVNATPVGRRRQTDDRGIYRLFGLPAGVYLVVADGNQWFSPQGLPYLGELPTYYPSAARDAAAEVKVQSGEEVTGIDIRYRGERGRVISGTVTGLADSGPPFGGGNVILAQAGTGMLVASTYFSPEGPERGFAFYGVADGDYELIARRFAPNNENGAASPPRRVTVRGADVSGVELVLSPFATISGQVLLETAKGRGQPGRCESKRDASLEEVIFFARRDEPGKNDERLRFLNLGADAAVNEKGEFAISNLMAARYRIIARLPAESWYTKSMTISGQGKRVIDAGRAGVTLKTGERAAGLTVTIAEGAAGIRGRVERGGEGQRWPSRLRVHLVPAEVKEADDLLRYHETPMAGDGSFALSHLAPGRYRLLARAVPDDVASDQPPRPAAWDPESRAKLRAEAETAGTEINLEPCQRVNDYALRFGKE